jgi:hypothetical protein
VSEIPVEARSRTTKTQPGEYEKLAIATIYSGIILDKIRWMICRKEKQEGEGQGW